MTERVGVGIIGAGVISAQYLGNLTKAADVEVRMVADLDVDRARERADEFGVAASGDATELLGRDDIEVVVNLTIPAAHVAVGLDVLAAGKHLYTEKPLALDRDGAATLLEAAQRTGLRVASAPDTLLGAGLQTGRRLIEAGVIGEPLTALTQFQVPGPESWHPNPDFLYARGGGPVFDMGPYYVSTLVQSLGPVARVIARGSRASDERVIGSGPRAGTAFPVEVLTHVAALLDFRDGATAQSTFSFQSTRPTVGVVEISGTEGTVRLPDPNTFDGDVELWRAGAGEPELVHAQGSTMTRGHGVIEFARAIREGRPERCSGEFAFHVLDVLIALTESAERNAPVEIGSTVDVPPSLPVDWDPLAATL